MLLLGWQWAAFLDIWSSYPSSVSGHPFLAILFWPSISDHPFFDIWSSYPSSVSDPTAIHFTALSPSPPPFYFLSPKHDSPSKFLSIMQMHKQISQICVLKLISKCTHWIANKCWEYITFNLLWISTFPSYSFEYLIFRRLFLSATEWYFNRTLKLMLGLD